MNWFKLDKLHGFDAWETYAYRIDVLRVVPRLALALAGFATGYVSLWFMDLKEPSTQQSAFASVVYGVIPLILNFYQSAGVDWEKRIAAKEAASASRATTLREDVAEAKKE